MTSITSGLCTAENTTVNNYCTQENIGGGKIWQIVNYSPKISSPIFTESDTPKVYLA